MSPDDTTPSVDNKPPICDVCLRRKITTDALDEFPDGTRCSEIAEALGDPICWARASGPCVSLGWARVRALEDLIRSAIAARGQHG